MPVARMLNEISIVEVYAWASWLEADKSRPNRIESYLMKVLQSLETARTGSSRPLTDFVIEYTTPERPKRFQKYDVNHVSDRMKTAVMAWLTRGKKSNADDR